MIMATSCMLANPMACCASCDVTQAHDTLRDVLPLTDALRDVITLSSHCHNLMSSPPSSSSSSSNSTPPSISRHHDKTFQDLSTSSPRPSPPRLKQTSASAASSSSCVTSVVAVPEIVPQVFGGVGLPVLKVSSSNVSYRGEGAEHIVLRVMTSGEVLRLRKTSVGAVNSLQDLVIRAYRDEEFLCNVARPILGSLLTDESRLVRIEPETIRELKDTVEPRRQVHRRHKEINNEGIACICPDAASVFISRCDSPTLSSSQASSNSYTTVHESPSPVPSSPHHKLLVVSPLLPTTSSPSSSPSSSPCEQVQNNVQGVQVNTNSILVSRDLTQETQSGLNLRTNKLLSTIRVSQDLQIESKISLPKELLASTTTDEIKEDDCRQKLTLSNQGLVASVEPQNICIEIKPKQGFIDTSTPDLPLCRYCVKQHIKIGKDAVERATSHYCPLDMFSGDLTRMRKAVDGLLESPQNNLKVFVDGEPVENSLSFRYLRDTIIAALTYNFTTAKADLPGDGTLSPQSPLGRTLFFQSLDQLGVFRAASLYSYLVQVIGEAKTADALLQDLKCWTGDSQFCQSNSKLCTRCTQDSSQQINGCDDLMAVKHTGTDTEEEKHRLNNNYSAVTDVPDTYLKGTIRNNGSSKLQPTATSTKSEADASLHEVINDDSANSYTQEDIIRKLQEYLLSTTAKDLSLMIMLSGPYRSSPAPSNTPNSSPFIIEVEAGKWFKCQVTGVDLVAKPPSKIFKHERDYKRLKAVLEELKKQGKEPACCKQ